MVSRLKVCLKRDWRCNQKWKQCREHIPEKPVSSLCKSWNGGEVCHMRLLTPPGHDPGGTGNPKIERSDDMMACSNKNSLTESYPQDQYDFCYSEPAATWMGIAIWWRTWGGSFLKSKWRPTFRQWSSWKSAMAQTKLNRLCGSAYKAWHPINHRRLSESQSQSCWSNWLDQILHDVPYSHVRVHERRGLNESVWEAAIYGQFRPTNTVGWTIIAWTQVAW